MYSTDYSTASDPPPHAWHWIQKAEAVRTQQNLAAQAQQAWLMQQAGGLGSTGSGDILDVQPDSLHQRVPVILGSPEDVNALRHELAQD